tara:strand:+ start:67 stop:3024 length:2958 start_codon:yes stop_codon:yes gene_type:complete
MKKKDLYKIVKEELEKELEEQRRSRREPRDRRRRLSKRALIKIADKAGYPIDGFENLLKKTGVNFNFLRNLSRKEFEQFLADPIKFIGPLNDLSDKIKPAVDNTGEPIDLQNTPCAGTINYTPLTVYGDDCSITEINDAFMCCGANNNAPNPHMDTADQFNIGNETGIEASQVDAGAGGCFCPNPQIQNGQLVGCGTTEITVSIVDTYITYINNLGFTSVDSLSVQELYAANSPEISNCYGCNDPLAAIPDQNDGFPSEFPGYIGQTVYNTGGTGYNPGAALGSESDCVYYGCTLNDPLTDANGDIILDQDGNQLPAYTNVNSLASPSNPYFESACIPAIIATPEIEGCTDTGDPDETGVNGDDGQIWWTSTQTIIAGNDAGTSYADLIGVADYPGFQPSNYNPDANVEDGSCIYDLDGDGTLDNEEQEGCTDNGEFDQTWWTGGNAAEYDYSNAVTGTYPGYAANNYNPFATEEDGTCDYDEDDDGTLDGDEIFGCTDSTTVSTYPGNEDTQGNLAPNGEGYLADNYNPNAEFDDGSCNYPAPTLNGCTVEGFNNYLTSTAVDNDGTLIPIEDDGSCDAWMVAICEDTNDLSYNDASDLQAQLDAAQTALDAYNTLHNTTLNITDDVEYVAPNELPTTSPYYNSDAAAYCTGQIVNGCTDSGATNYDSTANVDDGSCIYGIPGCIDPDACNYSQDATQDDGSCDYPDPPCRVCNQDPPLTDGTGYVVVSPDTDGDGICDAEEIPGCTDPDALNYDPAATDDDGSCDPVIEGCTNPNANNYNPQANTDDGSCELPNKCHDITARVCNTSQRGGKLGYPNINLQCVRINGQAVDMDSPATSQFKYPLPTQGVDASGNPVSFLKKEDNMAIYQVISAQITAEEDSYNLIDLEFGNCKGPVSFDPNDSDIKIPDFKEPSIPPININPLSTDQGTTTGVDSVRPDIPVRGREEISESKKIRKALRNEYMSSKEEKLKNIIKEALKNYKK